MPAPSSSIQPTPLPTRQPRRRRQSTARQPRMKVP
jgi:hypothetical protein